MKKVGIALIVSQFVGTFIALIVGKNPFAGGLFGMLGYFLCGIIGVILVILSYTNSKEKKRL